MRRTLLLLFPLIAAAQITTFPPTSSSGGGPPTGAAGGDLSGTYPNPKVATVNGSPVTAGLNNVLGYAAGITIGDGSAHIISGAPGGSPFNGITTLAGLAAVTVNGATPFSWVTSQTVPFAFTASQYNLTDAKVPNIDIAWLCIQTALLTGKTYIPAGYYIVGSVLPLPLYIPSSGEGQNTWTGAPIRLHGDGTRVTTIQAGSDWGSGFSLMICGDPAGTRANSLGRYGGGFSGLADDFSLVSPNGKTSYVYTAGARPINMDGFGEGARLKLSDLSFYGFNHDFTLVGDHTQMIRIHSYGGSMGMYLPEPNQFQFGDWAFLDLRLEENSIAGIGVSATANLNAVFDGETYIAAPYAILGETSATCSSIMSGVEFKRLFTEFIGNAFIQDDTGFSGGVYTDANKCRDVNKLLIDDWQMSYGTTWYWNTGGRQRRAGFDVQRLGMRVLQLESDSGTLSPPAIAGSTLVSTINALFVDPLGGIQIDGNIQSWISAAGTLPLINSGFIPSGQNVLITDTRQGWSGVITKVDYTRGNNNVSRLGDVLENEGPALWVMGGFNAIQPITGLALQAGLTGFGTYMPVATSGSAIVNTGAFAPTGVVKKGTGIGAGLTTVAGASGTNGTFAWVATGGGCTTEPTGNFTVTAGAIASYTITSQGSMCTSAPSISVVASAGLTGTLSAFWPSGIATASSGISDGPILGVYNFGGSSGVNQGIDVTLAGLNAGVVVDGTSVVITGGVLSAAIPTPVPPYENIKGTLYLPVDNMSTVHLPSFTSWTTIGTANTVTAQPNGDVTVATAGATFLAAPTQIASIEAVMRTVATGTGANTDGGVFVYDSTNSKIYSLNQADGTTGGSQILIRSWTYSGSGSPTLSSTVGTFNVVGQAYHLKASTASTTTTWSVSTNGGASFITLATTTVGTISSLGVYVGFSGGNTADVYSLTVN